MFVEIKKNFQCERNVFKQNHRHKFRFTPRDIIIHLIKREKKFYHEKSCKVYHHERCVERVNKDGRRGV